MSKTTPTDRKSPSKTLLKEAFLGIAELIVILGAALMLPAWTIHFWQAWAYIGIFGLAATLITSYLGRHDPELLERRIRGGPRAEKERNQKIIQTAAAISFVGILVVPSVDHRFGWSCVPTLVIVIGDFLVALGFYIVYLVFKANTFTTATIEVAPEQRVISHGPYALLRHPMYFGALVMLLGTPIALGSWWGLFMLLPIAFAIILRLLDEEKFLRANLQGYAEYCSKVRFRLIPFLW